MKKAFLTITTLIVALGLAQPSSAQSQFLRGDTNFDGTISILDALDTLFWLFVDGDEPICIDAADVNDNGSINLIDPLGVLNFLFVAGSPAPAAPYPVFEKDPTDDDDLTCKPDEEVVTGDIDTDETWTADSTYILESAVFVRNGATLTIEPGTTIIGDSETQGLLVVDRGGRLVAEGTATLPIVFTSENAVGERDRGDWGGIIMLGNGVCNLPGGEGEAEGLSGETWGGGDTIVEDDDSGSLSYVRVEWGGTEISPDNEVNALSMFGIGSGTNFDHIQVKYNLDDGFEWFGGSCDLKYGIAVGIGDDNFDYSFGWNGRAQFLVCQQNGTDADRGIEADNSESDFSATPLTAPVICNFTFVGDSDGTESDTGIVLRRGVGGELYNGIVTGFQDAGFDIDDIETADASPVIEYVSFYGNNEDAETGDNEVGFAVTSIGVTEDAANLSEDDGDTTVECVDPENLSAPDFTLSGTPEAPGFDPNTDIGAWFDSADYYGAVDPDATEDWTQASWISYQQD